MLCIPRLKQLSPIPWVLTMGQFELFESLTTVLMDLRSRGVNSLAMPAMGDFINSSARVSYMNLMCYFIYSFHQKKNSNKCNNSIKLIKGLCLEYICGNVAERKGEILNSECAKVLTGSLWHKSMSFSRAGRVPFKDSSKVGQFAFCAAAVESKAKARVFFNIF
jgi:hypothetical protein